jgi:hypothetical protein
MSSSLPFSRNDVTQTMKHHPSSILSGRSRIPPTFSNLSDSGHNAPAPLGIEQEAEVLNKLVVVWSFKLD